MSHLNDRKFKSFFKDGTTAEVSFATDTSSNTPYGQLVTGQYSSSNPSLSNGQYSFLRVDSTGALRTTATLTGDINVDSNSVSMTGLVGKSAGTNADFTTGYSTSTVLFCTGFPTGVTTINADDIVSVVQGNSAGTITATYTRDDSIFTTTGTSHVDVTVSSASFSIGDKFVVYTNIPRNTVGNIAHDAVDAGNPVKVGGYASSVTSLPTSVAAGDRVNAAYSLQGEQLAYLTGQIAGEDLANDVLKVELQYSRSNLTGDGLLVTGAGFLHSITISQNDAAPTAGSVIIYDNTAESGTILFSHTFTTDVPLIVSLIIDATFATGLYVGLSTTADVNVGVSYR